MRSRWSGRFAAWLNKGKRAQSGSSGSVSPEAAQGEQLVVPVPAAPGNHDHDEVIDVMDTVDRERATVEGTIAEVSVNIDPESRFLSAELHDGTGQVSLIWMGRQMIPGVELGNRMRATGVISWGGGRRMMFTPDYEVLKD